MTKERIQVVALVISFILLFLVVGAYFTEVARDYYNREHLIFSMNDPGGDDSGPGTYKYPIDSIFDPKKEHFDLRRFSFFSYQHNYYFDMNFPRVTNPWGAAEGFSHPIIEIYISTDSDSGRVEPFREGSNVLFDAENPWKYLIKVVSFNQTAVYWDSDFEGAEGRRDGVRASLKQDKKTIRVTVPKPLLPGDPANWKYYVLVGSQSGDGLDNFRPVRAQIGRWQFGGGTDTSYSPNVIDVLAPAGKQQKMLGSFSVDRRTQAVLVPVGPTQLKPSKWEEVLGNAAEILW